MRLGRARREAQAEVDSLVRTLAEVRRTSAELNTEMVGAMGEMVEVIKELVGWIEDDGVLLRLWAWTALATFLGGATIGLAAWGAGGVWPLLLGAGVVLVGAVIVRSALQHAGTSDLWRDNVKELRASWLVLVVGTLLGVLVSLALK